jgi:hypothetical protein
MRSGSVCAATLLLALPRSVSASVPPGIAGAVRRAVESGDDLNEIWLTSTVLEPVEDNDEDWMLNEALGNALTNTFGESEFDEKDDKVVTPATTTTTTASWAASRNEEWWKDPLAMFEDDEMMERPRASSAAVAPDPAPQEIETESVPEATEAVPVPDVAQAVPVETQSVAVTTAPPDVVATPAVVPPPATVPPVAAVAVDKVQETPPPVAAATPADQVEPQSRVSSQRPALFRRPSFTPVSRLLSGLAQHNATATTNHLLLALAVTKSSWMLVQYLRDKFLDPPPLEPTAARRQDDEEDEYEEEPVADPVRTSRHAAAVHPGGDSAVDGDYLDLDQEQDDDASLDKRGTSDQPPPEDFESDRSTTLPVTRRKSSRTDVSTEMAWWRRILGPRMPSARTLLLQIQELHAQVDQALLSRAAMEQAYEKCSAELQQRQTELTSLQQTIEYLQKQVADQLETRKRAIRLERKKAKEEMTKMKKTMVKVVERERQTMRDEFMKQAADLEALMRQEYEKTESSTATRKNEGRSGNITFQLQPTSKSA